MKFAATLFWFRDSCEPPSLTPVRACVSVSCLCVSCSVSFPLHSSPSNAKLTIQTHPPHPHIFVLILARCGLAPFISSQESAPCESHVTSREDVRGRLLMASKSTSRSWVWCLAASHDARVVRSCRACRSSFVLRRPELEHGEHVPMQARIQERREREQPTAVHGTGRKWRTQAVLPDKPKRAFL